MDWFMGKGRRKDKDCPTPPGPGEDQPQKAYLQEDNLKERVSDADFFKLVALPPYIDVNEWLATHTISLFNHVNLLYGVVSEYCTSDTCPVMSAPDNVQYFWYDDKGKKSKHTAPQYIDYVMAHIQKLVNDETVFPTKFDQSFPSDLDMTVKRIHKYLFQVLAHLYHAHYTLYRQMGLHPHLNTVFTHLMVFTSKFDLVPDRDTDILLPLFSLLLKNLADPAQNPMLREGLGIGEDELSIFASKTSQKSAELNNKCNAEDGNPNTDSLSVVSGTQTSSCSSPSHISHGNDSGVGDEDSVCSAALVTGCKQRASTPDSCSVSTVSSLASYASSAANTTRTGATDDGANNFLSSSFPPPHQHHHFPHHLHNTAIPPPSSSNYQKVSNGGNSLALHHANFCDTSRGLTAHPGRVVDCSGVASPMFSQSVPRSGLASLDLHTDEEEGEAREGEGPMVVDVDPTKPPSEWLSSMQVSAT